jgi:murein DD-endopeptidase MepM/ murein hydrolase activator NlpD
MIIYKSYRMKKTDSTKLSVLLSEYNTFLKELIFFSRNTLHVHFDRFEQVKSLFAASLYRQRGRLARRLMHSSMAGITAFGVMVAPIIAQEFPNQSINPWDVPSPSQVLSASVESPSTQTTVSEKMRDKIIEYTVEEGDTISSIADKFGVSMDTIRWQNDLNTKDQIKVGQTLEILPVTGVSYKVKKGDTVYSIAKKYETNAQAIVDFPYNTFVNDETFELAIGQVLIVPDGIVQNQTLWSPSTFVKKITPDAGTVVASGQFVWPTQGVITQRFSWYHTGIDIANRATPNVLAADSGTVVVAGWPDGYGYGNRVVIDHGNGYRTRYAHLQKIYVTVGQTVARGNAVGQMGSTGRSTGTHLHFEIMRNGVFLDPLSILQ